MRALPGRQSRAAADTAPATVTRFDAAADQRRRILRAIGELVAERGYVDVTVEMIVKRARVSYKTFYKHFSGKEACFIGFFDAVCRSTEQEVRRRLTAERRPWPEQVMVAMETLLDLIIREPHIAKAVIVEAPTVGQGIRERYHGPTTALAQLFRPGREFSDRAAELPSTVEDTLAGSVFWSAYQRLIVGEVELLPQLLPELVELVLRTYLGEAEAGRITRAELATEPSLA